jgi:hypothetical protein
MENCGDDDHREKKDSTHTRGSLQVDIAVEQSHAAAVEIE